LVDGVVVVLAQAGWSHLALEGVVLLFALGGLGLVYVLQPRELVSDSDVGSAVERFT
jgi:hypothetical protein